MTSFTPRYIEVARLHREQKAELMRLREAADAAMVAIRETDFSKAHRVLYEAREDEARFELPASGAAR